MNLKELDQEFERLKKSIEYIEAAEARFEKDHETDGRINPFDLWSLKRVLLEMREKFIRYATRVLQAVLCPNVRLDPEEIKNAMDKELGKEEFQTTWLEGYIQKTYVANQSALAQEQIKRALRACLPWVRDPGRMSREPQKPEELVDGRTISLRLHLYDPKYKSIDRHEVAPILDALVKAARIAIEGAPPEAAQGVQLPDSILNAKEPHEFFRLHALEGPIQSVRFLKRGAIVARLASRECALKLAQLILG